MRAWYWMGTQLPAARKPVQNPAERRREQDETPTDNNAANERSHIGGRALYRRSGGGESEVRDGVQQEYHLQGAKAAIYGFPREEVKEGRLFRWSFERGPFE